jgi:hypothetical protein
MAKKKKSKPPPKNPQNEAQNEATPQPSQEPLAEKSGTLYPYDEYIKAPASIGVSSRGSLAVLGDDIKAITAYVGVLMSGNSKAQMAPRLGNKYFMDTKTTCNTKTGETVPRYVFVNNIPSGKIAGYQGLVPGILENTVQLNPAKLFDAFAPDTPCQQITMTTVDVNNKQRVESQYVMQADIEDYNPCLFQNKKNPVSGKNCTEGMQMPNDPVVSGYFFGVGALAAYIVFRMLHKS